MFSFKDLRFKNEKFKQLFISNFVMNRYYSYVYENKWDFVTSTLNVKGLTSDSLSLLLTMIDNSNPKTHVSIHRSSNYIRVLFPDSYNLHLGEITTYRGHCNKNTPNKTLLCYFVNANRGQLRKYLSKEAYYNLKKYLDPITNTKPFLPLDPVPIETIEDDLEETRTALINGDLLG